MWFGWFRRGPKAPWQRMVEDSDLGHCHHLLLQATPADAPSLNRCLTAGGVPVDVPGKETPRAASVPQADPTT
jgi:hypothetical protein